MIDSRTCSRAQTALSTVAAARRATHSDGTCPASHRKAGNQSPNEMFPSRETIAGLSLTADTSGGGYAQREA